MGYISLIYKQVVILCFCILANSNRILSQLLWFYKRVVLIRPALKNRVVSQSSSLKMSFKNNLNQTNQ